MSPEAGAYARTTKINKFLLRSYERMPNRCPSCPSASPPLSLHWLCAVGVLEMPTSCSSIGGAIHLRALADRKRWLWRLVGLPVGEGKSNSAGQPQANFQVEEHGGDGGG
nr:uncharacterized protein LOC127336173 [Lolium perenne]